MFCFQNINSEATRVISEDVISDLSHFWRCSLKHRKLQVTSNQAFVSNVCHSSPRVLFYVKLRWPTKKRLETWLVQIDSVYRSTSHKFCSFERFHVKSFISVQSLRICKLQNAIADFHVTIGTKTLQTLLPQINLVPWALFLHLRKGRQSPGNEITYVSYSYRRLKIILIGTTVLSSRPPPFQNRQAMPVFWPRPSPFKP